MQMHCRKETKCNVNARVTNYDSKRPRKLRVFWEINTIGDQIIITLHLYIRTSIRWVIKKFVDSLEIKI